MCATRVKERERESTWARYLLKKIFIIASLYRRIVFSGVSGIVKRICTHSSAARSSVKRRSEGARNKRDPFYLSLSLSLSLFLFCSSNLLLLTAAKNIVPWLSVIYIVRVEFFRDYRCRSRRSPSFLLEGRNLGQVAVRRCTRSCEIEGYIRLSIARCRVDCFSGRVTSTISKRGKKGGERADRFSLLRARKNGHYVPRRVLSEEIDRGIIRRIPRTCEFREGKWRKVTSGDIFTFNLISQRRDNALRDTRWSVAIGIKSLLAVPSLRSCSRGRWH